MRKAVGVGLSLGLVSVALIFEGLKASGLEVWGNVGPRAEFAFATLHFNKLLEPDLGILIEGWCGRSDYTVGVALPEGGRLRAIWNMKLGALNVTCR